MRGFLLFALACLCLTALSPTVTALPPLDDPAQQAAACPPVTLPLYPWAVDCVNRLYGTVSGIAYPYVHLACVLVVFVLCDVIGGPICLTITCA